MRKDIGLFALCAVPDLGPVSQRLLLQAFGSPENVFRASSAELATVDGIGRKRAESIKSFDGWDTLSKVLAKLEKEGIKAVRFTSDNYPTELKKLGDDAPLVLYVKGEIMEEDRFALAVIGSRKPTEYGKNVAEKLAQELASRGFTVVSGLARGIDSAAHKGSIRCGGRSIAVLGSGIDVPYPPENRGLMERLTQSGAVVSEFPPGTPPLGGNFPRRNRIISGISMGVVVVEAGVKSGALITANYALEQGKDVFAVPGNISSPESDGTNKLIKDGAKVVTTADDIVEELAPQLKGFIRKAREKEAVSVSGDEQALCAIMGREPLHVDVISRKSGLTASKTLAMLLGLELKGIVRQTGGKKFHLV
jgi:DNA processing protein